MDDARTGFRSTAQFLRSARTDQSPETPDPDAFLAERSAAAQYRVDVVPLGTLPGWHTGDLVAHESGRFFTVEGIDIQTNFGPADRWCQPIIVQPEIGILGILVKRIHGVPHFLMQAKMEPGNTIPTQFAATVQATPSNYQRVHGGRPTPYLEYFRDRGAHRTVFDQLLSEHGSWYLRKRNRNMIVEVPENEDVDVLEDYTWLTLGQLRRQLRLGSRVNMNTRTILSGITYAEDTEDETTAGRRGDFDDAVVQSHTDETGDDELRDVTSWLNDQKATYSLTVRRIPLTALDGWTVASDSIHRQDGSGLRIVGMSVSATSREVTEWSQPMLEPTPQSTILLLCQRQSGKLRMLMQATVQPGLIDGVELTATVHVNDDFASEHAPPFSEYADAPESWERFNAMQSEDGGRFLRADTVHRVVEIPEDHLLELPANYRWMTLGLLQRLIRSGYVVNIEARSLVSCLL